jgi:hypothetical protein
VLDELPADIALPIAIQMIANEDDEVGWEAAVTCGYALDRKVWPTPVALDPTLRRQAIEKLDSFSQSGAYRSRPGEELDCLKTWLGHCP